MNHRTPVAVDGIRYDSLGQAEEAIGAPAKSLSAYRKTGKTYKGHVLDFDPDRKRPTPPKCAPEELVPRRIGTPLLIEPCTHRLGVYLGGRW